MEYRVEGKFYHFNYSEMKGYYHKYSDCSDEEFIKDIPNILHFACFVSYLKELGIEATVGDEGIIHQLVHLLTETEGPSVQLAEIREQFNLLMRL